MERRFEMGHFLEVAFRVLKDKNKPLPSDKITEIGINKGWLKTKGLTPKNTMKSKLSSDILQKKEKSLFMRTGKAEFALREWRGQYKEYIADRFKKALLDELIPVFPSEVIMNYIPGPGLNKEKIERGADLIKECFPMQRRIAEQDYQVIQLISVFILRYREKYLTYKRTARLPEKRLHHSYSVFFGGHISQNDIDRTPIFNVFTPKIAEVVLLRELSEEIEFPKYKVPDLQYVGILYDDSRAVSSQHLGIVYYVYLKSKEYKINERGFLMRAKFESLDEIDSRIHEFENWSVLIANHERLYSYFDK